MIVTVRSFCVCLSLISYGEGKHAFIAVMFNLYNSILVNQQFMFLAICTYLKIEWSVKSPASVFLFGVIESEILFYLRMGLL